MWKRLQELLAAYQEKDPAAHSKLEIFLLYPGVHALICHRIAHWFYKRNRRFLARWTEPALPGPLDLRGRQAPHRH